MVPALNVGPRLRAGRSDIESIAALLHERSAWLQANGIDQWQPPYPIDRLAREVDEGVVWYWRAAVRLVATVTLLTNVPDYYPPGLWSDDRPSWYVCRFATALDWQDVA
jgi:hypothetical protein